MTPVLGQRLRGERAFERLYNRHVADVYRYSLALLRNPADAEDVTQTTFLNAYRALRAGERPDAPRAWLIAIAHNVCRQRFRTAARRVQEVAFEETVAEAAVPDPEAPSAEEIQRALGHLAFNQRAALVMRELEGRSYAEIAEVLGVSTSAVETLLFRARRALREQLEGSISCHEAEVAISKQLDGRLSRGERGTLRAHLRECGDCATLARKQRAQRAAIRSLGLLPLPSSLAAWGGGAAAATGTAVGGGVALKAAAVVAAGTVAVGVAGEAATRLPDAAPPPGRVAAPKPAVPSAPVGDAVRARAVSSRTSAGESPGAARRVGGGGKAAPETTRDGVASDGASRAKTAPPAHRVPVKGAPVKGAPVKGVPVKGAPVKGAPVKGAPAQPGPAKAASAKAARRAAATPAPANARPARSGAARPRAATTTARPARAKPATARSAKTKTATAKAKAATRSKRRAARTSARTAGDGKRTPSGAGSSRPARTRSLTD